MRTAAPIQKGTNVWGWTKVVFPTSPVAYIEIEYSTEVRDCISTFYTGGQTVRNSKGEVREILSAISVWNSQVVPYVRGLGFDRINVVIEDKDELMNKRIRLYKRMGFVVHPGCVDSEEDEVEMIFFLNENSE